jgi:hypothetical protein
MQRLDGQSHVGGATGERRALAAADHEPVSVT